MKNKKVMFLGVAALVVFAAARPAPAVADNLADTIATCAGCHGEDGVPLDKTFPVIAGQNRTYLLNQLWDFKNGRRPNEIMTGIVAEMSWKDMQALAAHFSKQPWPAIEAPALAPEVKAKATPLLDQYNCAECHQLKYEGDTVRPRLAGQHDEYLVKTMQEFRDHARKNYINMSSLLREFTDDDLKAVSAYLASLPPPPEKK